MSDAKKTAGKFIAAIDECELACRMFEAAAGVKRPPGKEALQALLTLPDEDRAGFQRAARAAMKYCGRMHTESAEGFMTDHSVRSPSTDGGRRFAANLV